MTPNETPNKSSENDNHPPTPNELDDLFASGEINRILKQAKIPEPPAPKPDIAAIQKHRADQKRIPKVSGSKKPKKVHIQTRRSKPKGRQ